MKSFSSEHKARYQTPLSVILQLRTARSWCASGSNEPITEETIDLDD